MARRSVECREAQGWLAAAEAGQLSVVDGLRLQQHVDGCESCRLGASGLAAIATALRDEPSALGGARLDRLWQRVEQRRASSARQATRVADAASPMAPARRRWLRVGGAFAAAAVAAAAAAVLMLGLRSSSDPAPHQPSVATSTPKPAKLSPAVAGRLGGAVKAIAPPPRPSPRPVAHPGIWRVLVARATRHGSAHAPLNAKTSVTKGDHLYVAPGGRAVLASAREVLIVDGGSTLRLLPTAVELLGGRVAIRTRGGRSGKTIERELEVHAHGLIARPLGTAYAVTLAPGAAPVVAVASGRVEVSGTTPASASVTVPAGMHLRWGLAPDRLPRRARAQLQRELAHALALSEQRMAVATHAPGVRPARRDAPTTEAVEQLIAKGELVAARQLARRALRGRPDRSRALFLLLIAESFLRGRDYRQAHGAYQQLLRQAPRSTYGADALYMIGSLEFDRLAKPAAAAQRFAHYLSRYPRGRLREGAFYLRCRALLASARRDQAARVAREYLQAYPRGQYTSELRRLVTSIAP